MSLNVEASGSLVADAGGVFAPFILRNGVSSTVSVFAIEEHERKPVVSI